ncbi:hypothetical protein Tco_1523703 [Tanacetum coccineum]
MGKKNREPRKTRKKKSKIKKEEARILPPQKTRIDQRNPGTQESRSSGDANFIVLDNWIKDVVAMLYLAIF